MQDSVSELIEAPAFKQPKRSLKSKQERRLVDYLDQNFLELTRNFKKRLEQSSTLKTLTNYVDAVRRLLVVILQIPPIDPSTGLRIAYLLRITGDVLGAIPGYSLGAENAVIQETLQALVDFLDDLDQAWVAVLQGQVWDPATAQGIDLVITFNAPNDNASPDTGLNGYNEPSPTTIKSTPPTQTDVARLRSLIFAGESAIEEWLVKNRNQLGTVDGQGDELGDISGMLARMGVLDDFDSLFVRTLDFLGGFAANVSQNTINPAEEGMME